MDFQWLRFFALLLFAHLVGDFVLQVDLIQQKKKKWFWNALHSLVHATLAYLVIADWKFWIAPTVIFVSHFLIDWGKLRTKNASAAVFLLDQILHWLLLLGLSLYMVSQNLPLPTWVSWQAPLPWTLLVTISGLILLIPCGGYLIGAFVQPYQEQIEKHYKSIKKTPIRGLHEGGKIIGILERVLIFIFMMLGQYAGIGFLVAAKSIFRFGEFKESENRMEAEYIIIGTFASFLFSILVSIGIKALLGLGNG